MFLLTHYQSDNNINRNPLDLYKVNHNIQDTDVFGDGIGSWISHENLDSFIVCVLLRWNLAIHTVGPKLDIIDLTDGLSIQCLG